MLGSSVGMAEAAPGYLQHGFEVTSHYEAPMALTKVDVLRETPTKGQPGF